MHSVHVMCYFPFFTFKPQQSDKLYEWAFIQVLRKPFSQIKTVFQGYLELFGYRFSNLLPDCRLTTFVSTYVTLLGVNQNPRLFMNMISTQRSSLKVAGLIFPRHLLNSPIQKGKMLNRCETYIATLFFVNNIAFVLIIFAFALI